MPLLEAPPRSSGAKRAEEKTTPEATVVDLFSGAGGMSSGFARHPAFEVIGAADAEIGKPSSGPGSLGCNRSYFRNIGVAPIQVDLGEIPPEELRDRLGLTASPTVLIACPPCTGFSRTLAKNHLVDDVRNSLVGRVGAFVRVMQPEIVVIENARELITGRFSKHFASLKADLESQNYVVSDHVHFLSDFGLPQRRERALIIAAKKKYTLFSLLDLWDGFAVKQKATYVRHAIGSLPSVVAGEAHSSDPFHVSPRLVSEVTRRRLAAIPPDGGSWFQLIDHPEASELLTPSMKQKAAAEAFGSHPDVYGRLWWDRPAATIKRECGHIGNGRYTHPEQNRLCTVRELALLQGFPEDYEFDASSITNMYRHVGDAVPPMIAFQIASTVAWSLGGKRPAPEQFVLPGTSLRLKDVIDVS
jgi:DNA (cytosine-5)-methyltransferase 1